jgi:sulfur-oxidizing protein SoxY
MDPTRRSFLVSSGQLAGGFALACLLPLGPAAAAPAKMQDAMRKIVGEAALKDGKVKLDLPPLVESGNAVPLSVTIDSPMTAADHVKAIHVFTEKNPQPNVASFHLGPRSGRAHVSTRIRLADTQEVVAIAELSDGSFWSARAHVVITLAACLEDG